MAKRMDPHATINKVNCRQLWEEAAKEIERLEKEVETLRAEQQQPRLL